MRKFRKFDSDGSGCIESKELAALLEESHIKLNADEFRSFMRYMDPSNNGNIEFREFQERMDQAIDPWAKDDTSVAQGQD
jgi:Ca2+-binding EF-hand superfamily protein